MDTCGYYTHMIVSLSEIRVVCGCLVILMSELSKISAVWRRKTWDDRINIVFTYI